jgi:hypothetical protein
VRVRALAVTVLPRREYLITAGVGGDDRRREPGQCNCLVDGASGRDDERERFTG